MVDCFFYLRLFVGFDIDVFSFVLKENEIGEVEVGSGFFVCGIVLVFGVYWVGLGGRCFFVCYRSGLCV